MRQIMVVNPGNKEKISLHKLAEKKLNRKIPKQEFYRSLDCFYQQHGYCPNASDFSIIDINVASNVNVVVPVGKATSIEYQVNSRSRKHRKGVKATYRHNMENSMLVMDCVNKKKNQFYVIGSLKYKNDGWLHD